MSSPMSSIGRRRPRAGVVALSSVLGLPVFAAAVGCSSAPGDDFEPQLGRSQEPLTAVCEANVKGIGLVDAENKYLPNVVHCENGGAPYEALKVQAIAARTYLYYKMETAGAIADGTGDQVYSCGSSATAEQLKAVKETAGIVLRYKATTICSFFVAGGAATPPGCVGASSASTEKYVTYNAGKSGTGIDQTTLGWVSPTNNRNRGCMSQLGSRCLATEGKKYDEILRFYYGEDIVFEKATGPCVDPTPDAGPVDTGAPPGDAGGADGVGPLDTGVSDVGGLDAGPLFDARADAPANGDGAPGDSAPGDDPTGDLQGGCGCEVPGAGREVPSAGPAALALAVALAGRRRRYPPSGPRSRASRSVAVGAQAR